MIFFYLLSVCFFYHNFQRMPAGKSCYVCKHTKAQDPGVHMHRFPANPQKRHQWLQALDVEDKFLPKDARVCSRHFRNGNTANLPSMSLGKRFASPAKRRALTRQPHAIPPRKREKQHPPKSLSKPCYSPCDVMKQGTEDDDLQVGVNTALLARIEFLEQENMSLKHSLETATQKPFRIEDIAHDDRLVRTYTGFPSYVLLLAFYAFLGPAVDHLKYWGTKGCSNHRQKKLNPLNCLFLTLIKLRLNLTEQDLAFRFGISTSTVSRYFITWVCFLYNHLREIDWCPSPDQVACTLPHAFKDKYPTTYIIIDASEIFLETPSDLVLQSSTWSNYKQHNTAKYLIGVTPNGAILFVSQVFVGSISAPQLTHCSGLLSKLEGKHNISVMADRGFTICDQLQPLGIKLNIPPFLDGREQLKAEEVQQGRSIASIRIHVERAIGRMKNFTILKDVFPINMARIANQIVSVCAWLTNFFPPLVPPPTDKDTDACISSSDEDSDLEDIELLI